MSEDSPELRMYKKLREAYDRVESCAETLSGYQSDGVIAGFTQEILD